MLTDKLYWKEFDNSWLRVWRLFRGYTPAWMAERLKMTETEYDDVEKGFEDISEQTGARLAMALGITVGDLAQMTEPAPRRKRTQRMAARSIHMPDAADKKEVVRG
jgi:hypothetical protein